MSNMSIRRALSALSIVACAVVAFAGFGGAASAEQGELRIAKQYGLEYLTLMVMEDWKLLEKLAKDAGMGDFKVTWATFRSSDTTGKFYNENPKLVAVIDFSFRAGSIKQKPDSWKDLFFPVAHGWPGS